MLVKPCQGFIEDQGLLIGDESMLVDSTMRGLVYPWTEIRNLADGDWA